MPITWRRDVAPHYQEWIIEGLARLAEHPATIAGLQLAGMLISWTPAADTIRARADAATGNLTQMLRDYGIKPEQVTCRVAMLTAFLRDNPMAARGTRAERFAYARAVLGLLPWTGSGSIQRVGALALDNFGALVMDHLSLWASKLVAKLHADLANKGDLKRQSANY